MLIANKRGSKQLVMAEQYNITGTWAFPDCSRSVKRNPICYSAKLSFSSMGAN